MEKPVSVNSKEKIATPNIFSLLKPYSGIVIVLIIMALLGSGVNMLIPKIIARAIDAFSPVSLMSDLSLFSFWQLPEQFSYSPSCRISFRPIPPKR